MKKFLLIISLLLNVAAFSQIKITDLPTLSDADSGWLLIAKYNKSWKFSTDSFLASGSNFIIFDSIPEMQAYTGTARTAFVRDSVRGGIFNEKDTGYTHDGGVAFLAVGLGGGTKMWVRHYAHANFVNVKWWGAKGNGIAYDRLAEQAACNFIATQHPGGTVYYPTGVYRDTFPVYWQKRVNMLGEGRGSVIRNTRPLQGQGYDQNCILLGNMLPSLYEELQPHTATTVYGNRIKLANAGDVPDFQVGQIITIASNTGWLNKNGDFKPYYATYNRVDSILSGTRELVLEYAVESLLTNATIGIEGQFQSGAPRGGNDVFNHPSYFVSDLTISNMSFISEGQWIGQITAYKVNLFDIYVSAAELIGGNGLSHCHIKNVTGEFWKQVTEISMYSHDSKIEHVDATWINRDYLLKSPQPLIITHENSRNMSLSFYNIKAGKSDGGTVITMTDGVNNRFDHIMCWGDSIKRGGVEMYNHKDESVLRNCVVSNSEFHLGSSAVYVQIEKSDSGVLFHGVLDGNIIKDSRFYGDIGTQNGKERIVSWAGTNNSIFDCYFEDGDDMDVEDSSYNNRMSRCYMNNPYVHLAGVTVQDNYTYETQVPNINNDTTNSYFGYKTSKLINGDDNIAIGKRSLFHTDNVRRNIGIGNNTLYSNISGDNNLAVGDSALYFTTNANNTAVGHEAGKFNVSGTMTVMGKQANYYNVTGGFNVAVGVTALMGQSGISSGNNTAIGANALQNSIGGGNTALGTNAGIKAGSTTNSIYLGREAGPIAANATNSNYIVLGYGLAPSGWNVNNGANLGGVIFLTNRNGTDSIAATTGKMAINNISPTAFMDLPPGNNTTATLRLRPGRIPSSANIQNGDVVYDSVSQHMYGRINGLNKQLDNDTGSTGGGGGGAPTGPAGGDLYGTYPNPQVGGIRNNPIPSLSTGFLRWNGTNWIFAEPVDTAGGGSNPTGPAGGDLYGTYPNPQVGGILNNPVPPLSTGFLRWNGASWAFEEPTTGGGTGSFTTVADIPALLVYDRDTNTAVIVVEQKRGGLFTWSASGTSNSITIFPAVGGGFWYRQYNQSEGVDVKWGGATGNGVTNDRDNANAVIQAFKKVRFTPGNYLIDADYNSTGGLFLISNQEIIIDKAATVTVQTNALTAYQLFRINGVDNVVISGGKLVGDRVSHTGSTGESGMLIAALNSNNVRISGIEITEAWGDGIYIGGIAGEECTNVIIENNNVHDCRRNGTSIVGCIGAVVNNNFFHHNNGTLPEAGLDLEPNSGVTVKDIVGANNHFYNNNGPGFVSTAVNVNFTNGSSHNNGTYGVYVSRFTSPQSFINVNCYENTIHGFYLSNASQITLTNCLSRKNGQEGVRMVNCEDDIKVIGCLIDSNTNNGILVSSPDFYKYHIIGNTIRDNGSAGLNSGSNNAVISANIVYRNTSYGILAGGNGSEVFGNEIYENGLHGIYVFGDRNSIQSNYVHSNSQAANNFYDNIFVGVDASYNFVNGNTVKAGTKTNKPKYGINVNAITDSFNTVYINNRFDGGATADFRDAGFNTMQFIETAPLDSVLKSGNISARDLRAGQITATNGLISQITTNGNWAIFRTENFLNRWVFLRGGTETGTAAAGSDFQITSRNDDGTSRATVMRMFRSTGNIRIGSTSTDPGYRLFLDSGAIVANKFLFNPLGSAANGIYTGVGIPEGVQTASVGSAYLKEGGVHPFLYIKYSGSGNTGWVGIDSGSGGGGGGGGPESDPIALSKTITLIAGTGVTIPESATQTLNSNPSWTINSTGGSSPSLDYTLQSSNSSNFNPGDATSYYFGGNPFVSATANAGINRIYIPTTGTIEKAVVLFNNAGTAGTATTSSIYVRINNTTDVLISSGVLNSSSVTTVSNGNLGINVLGIESNGTLHDYIEVKWVTPTWTTNPTNVRVSIILYIKEQALP